MRRILLPFLRCRREFLSLGLVCLSYAATAQTYCVPSPNSCIGEGVTNVTFGTLNNTSTACSAGGYADYTNLPAPVIPRGSSVPISLGLKVNASGGAAIWIDYDHDGVFAAAECTLIAPVTGTNVTVTSTVNIPASALTGPTRMRVREAYGTVGYPGSYSVAAGSACMVNDYTEFEDYLVNLQDPCSGMPNGGTAVSSATSVCSGATFTLSLSGVTAVGLTYQWFSKLSSSSAFTPISGATNPTYTASQSAATDYYCQVTCTNGGQSANSAPVTVSMNPFNNCYCLPSYSSGCSNDNISSVTLSPLSETGLACVSSPGYTDRTSVQTGSSATLPIPDLIAGQNSTLTLTFGSDGNQYSGVWIDFNHNGTFNTNEYFTTNSNAGGGGTANITLAVPASALAGQTRMRIRGGDDNQPANSQACNASYSNYGVARDYLVNIIQVTAPPPCVAAPTAPANGGNTCIAVTPTTLSWPAAATASSYDVYLDQGTASTLVGNVTTTSYTTAAPLAAGAYSWKIVPKNSMGNASGCTTFTFTVNALPVVSVTPASGAYCTSGSLALGASGASSYAWSPGTGLSATSGSSVMANPSVITTYTVTGTDNNGCSNTATTIIGPLNRFMPQAASQTICGGPATLAVSPITAATGAMEYQMTDTLGNVVAPWQAGTSFTFTPALTGLNKYFVFAHNTSCPADLSDTGYVNIFSGFSAGVTANNATCVNGNGSLVINNPQGAGQFSNGTWYSNDFSTPSIADTTIAALRGGASITNNALQLTSNAANQNGGLLVKNPLGITANVDSVKFVLSIPQNGADGISWSFADNIVYNGGGQLEAGAGDKLIISFDAYTNSTSSSPGANGIYLTYGQAGGGNISPTVSATMLAYSANTSWRGASNTPVAVYITSDGKLTLKLGSTVIFNQVQLPSAYVGANRSNWQHLFAARTGGTSEQHVIDNTGIYYSGNSFVYGASPAHSNTVPASWQNSKTFSGLNGGDSLDLWIANPSNPSTCNQKLGTYGVSGPLVTAVLESGAPSCVSSSDGYISMQVSGSGTYGATYSKDGGTPVVLSGLIAQSAASTNYINIPNLPSGSYTNLKVTSSAGCVSNIIAGPIVLANAAVATIAASSSSVTVAQGGGTQYYTDASCGVMAAVSSANNLGNVTTAVTIAPNPVATPLNEPFLGRYYEITPSMNAGLPATLILYFSQADFDSYNTSPMVGTTYPAIAANGSNIRIRAYHGSSSAGTTGPNGTYDAANSDLLAPASVVLNSSGFWEVTVSSPNGFSGFFANTNTSTPLAITLKSFGAENKGAVNLLTWETLGEKTGDYFVIERSKDSRSFSRLDAVTGKGTPSVYHYTDQHPFEGTTYYRLSLINADGTRKYSEVVKANVKGSDFAFEVYPNPVKEQLSIRVSDVRGPGRIEVADVTGRTVTTCPVPQNGLLIMATDLLPSGTYFVRYYDEVHTRSLKISKQ